MVDMRRTADDYAQETAEILKLADFLINKGATALEISYGATLVKCNLNRTLAVRQEVVNEEDAKDDPAELWKTFSESAYYAGSEE
jgi:hypothetical protein